MSVNIPSEHMEVVNKTSIFIQQFSLFMNGENSSIIIRNEEEYSNAAVVIKSVKDHKKEVEASKDVVVTPLREEYETALEKFQTPLKNLKEKIDALEEAGRSFRKIEDKRKADEQLRLDQEAANAIKAAEKATEKATEKAEEYETQGRTEKAEEWRSKAASAENVAQSIVPAIAVSNIPKTGRGSFNNQKRYAARILNSALILDHLKAALPPDILEAIQKWANTQARAARGAKSALPGVEFYEV